MNEVEQQREVGDAIILECAVRVPRRHDFRDASVLERICLTFWTLGSEARKLRGECGSV